MAESFISEAQSNAPSKVGLLDILKSWKNENNQEFNLRWTDINNLLSDSIHPLFENIDGDPYSNEQLGEILLEIFRQLLVNKKEIIYTKHLIALLTFELQEQGIEINDKELQQNFKTYLKIK